MPAKVSQIKISLEQPVYTLIKELAEINGLSIAMETKKLLNEALEIEEDVALTSFAMEREVSYNKSNALTHDEVWE